MRQIMMTWVVIAVVIASVSAASAAKSQPKVFFPLMAWDYVDNEATLKSMAECGINSVGFVRPNMLDTCQKYGIKGIIVDDKVAAHFGELFNADRACKALPALIKKYGNHPALYGYHLRDEPGVEQFEALGKASAMIQKLNPGKWPYVCNYPGIGDDYVKLIEDFIAKVHPTILCYDNYGCLADGSFSWGFWANIADYRSIALKHKLPFQTIVLTSPHWGYEKLTQEQLRIEVYGSLIYGARGIGYYKFMSCSLGCLNCADLGNFRNGPLDEFGEKTETWNWLRNINRQVMNLAPTLLKLRSDDVYHFGDVPQRNHGPSEKSLVKALPGGSEWTVGEFTHEDGSRWVMILNKDLKASHFANVEFSVPVKKVQYLSAITGKLDDYRMAYYCLAPGQGVLLKLMQ